jgi:hypothetical protein
MSNELAVIESKKESANAGTLMRQATDVAGVCGEIVKRTARNIQGRKYVQVEGWQSIAVAYGCVASARDVEKVEGGIRAIGEVRRMADGALIAQAEGFVGDDEKTWASRPEYARRAMAQTRSISRACRSAFAFVVTMIDGSLSTTPAEEVPDGGFDVAHVVADKTAALKAALRPAAQQTVNAPPASPPHGSGGLCFPNYGRAKGQAIAGAAVKDLEFYAAAARKSLADPEKARWHNKERTLLEAIEAELSKSNQGTSEEPPPPSDADAPF